YTDEEVVTILQKTYNDEAMEYIVKKYRNFIKAKARTYFLVGADRDDIIQEGMIGLYKATRDFRKEKNVSFRSFAELCITRQIITAIKTATRQKHIPLNTYVSLSKPVYEDESVRRLEDIIIGIKIMDPEELFISKENYTDMKIHLESLLSSLEQQVLRLYLEGQSYQEMSQSLQRPAKSIDNALQRIKHKIEVYLKNRDNECP
ncbi:RNA polymerase sporulation sigma factor SigH, partial [uncultured Megasphaera sp.]|uniref:RNA polymerase sporulation sigma factor SigH n=1 Tax=uncultured Megasphaera sp. TaxID=165188 RepID=UPI002593B8E9